MDYLASFILFLILLLFVSATLYFILRRIIEPAYILLFNRPLYVHFYPLLKKLTLEETTVLEQNFSFYRKLSEQRKKYFRHRVKAFIENYRFVGRHGIVVSDEMKIKIAATSVMLSFGMRDYLLGLFNVIIIYPDIFESANGDYHKGEFNPAAKAVVFSWKHFEEGISFDSDNLNLGLHEFAHVLHLNAISRRRPGASYTIYSDMFDEIREYAAVPYNRDKVMNSGYLREYAYTNQYEFMAVVFEYFFETPDEFRQKLPELYGMVRKMINYR